MEEVKEDLGGSGRWREFAKDYAPVLVGLMAAGVAAWCGKFQVDASLKIAQKQDSVTQKGWLASSLQASRVDKFEALYIEIAQLDIDRSIPDSFCSLPHSVGQA